MPRAVEVLSVHETEARFLEVAKLAVEAAVFRVERYTKYERVAATAPATGVEKKVVIPLEQAHGFADRIRALRPGQAVTLTWWHEYVTLAHPDGSGTQHFPIRNIQVLEPRVARTSQPLSVHETEAKFTGLQPAPCRARTALCPTQCGHGGDAAGFEIEAYVRYEKPASSGDGKKEKFLVKLADAGPFADQIRALPAGQAVRLNWVHEYVTLEDEEGRKTHRPERTVTLLEVR